VILFPPPHPDKPEPLSYNRHGAKVAKEILFVLNSMKSHFVLMSFAIFAASR
jgi:hypothetical protein